MTEMQIQRASGYYGAQLNPAIERIIEICNTKIEDKDTIINPFIYIHQPIKINK